MPTVYRAWNMPGMQWATANGVPLAAGRLRSFLSGTSTPQPTYTSETGLVPNADPIVFDAAGRVPSNVDVWLKTGVFHRLELRDSALNLVAVLDGVSGVGDPGPNPEVGIWIAGPEPTWIASSAAYTEFTVEGDQRPIFQDYRRARLVDAFGTHGGTVIATEYVVDEQRTRVFTQMDGSVTVANPLGSVQYSVLSADDDAVPRNLEPVGTTRDGFFTSAPNGWLLMFGQTIGNVLSGAAVESPGLFNLFQLLRNVAPNTGAEVWANGDVVILPDFRGRVGAGRDDMGGVAAGRLTATTVTPDGNTRGATGGAQTHALTEAEGPAHAHGGGGNTGSAGDHQHASAGDHQHASAGDHNHQLRTKDNGAITGTNSHLVGNPSAGGFVAFGANSTGPFNSDLNVITSAGAHQHASAGDHQHASAGDHQHTYDIPSSGSNDPHNNAQPTMIVNKMIKT